MAKRLISIFVPVLFLAFAQSVSAAVLYILPESGAFGLNREIGIDIKINSEGESINAAQATLAWPTDILEFVAISKTGSVFNFWVEEPEADSGAGTLRFTGGGAKGVSGDALQILKITFRTRGTGDARVSLADAAITASDGKGTNVLSNAKGAEYRIGAAAAPETSAPSTPPATPQPVRVQRPAISAEKLPQKPEIAVPLYPDPEQWHNQSGETIALWEVPNDIIAMAASLDRSPNTIPQKQDAELATGKNFGILQDGVWYVHARFRNNIGWGPTSHYRLAIDTKPPLIFTLELPEGETTDNPAPVIRFRTSDALSGLKEYQVRLDGSEAIHIPAEDFTGSFILPLQEPGTRRVSVRALDRAENSIEDSATLEILPLPSPIITFVTRELFSEEERGLTVKGTALPDADILLRVQRTLNGEGRIATEDIVRTDTSGNWDFTLSRPLRNGTYVVFARSRDARGALSLEVESAEIRVKSKPIISAGPFQLGRGGAALFLLLVLAFGFGGGVWFYRERQKKLALRVSFAELEIAKIFSLLRDDVARLVNARKSESPAEEEYAIKKLDENIQKMERYLKKGVEKIRK